VNVTAVKDHRGLITVRSSTSKPRLGTTTVSFDDSSINFVEATDTASMIIQSLSLESGTRLLLCAMWATEDGLRYFSKFPTVLGLDTTFGTNAEKRPLARGTGKNMLRNNLPWLNCFLPSEAQWVWHWILQKGLPSMLPRTVLNSIRLILTDGDSKCYEMVDAAIKCSIFPNAQRRLCSWHKINRGYVLPARTHCTPGSTYDRPFIENVCRWLEFFVRNVETEWEETHSINEFEAMLDSEFAEGTVSQSLVLYTGIFFNGYFVPRLSAICFRHYIRCPGGMHTTTSMCESENKRLKYSVMGPRPQHSIDVAHSSIVQVETSALQDIEGRAYRSTSRKTNSVVPYEVSLSLSLNDLAVRLKSQSWCWNGGV